VRLLAGATRWAVAVVLIALMGACATAPPRSTVPPARTITRDAEVLVLASGRTHFFENRHPHCLAYVLDGEWEFAAPVAALRTADRSRFVGVVLQDKDALPDPGSSDLVSRAITHIIADTEKEWGGPLQVKVEGFATLKPGAVLLEFEDVTITPALVARMTGPNPPAVGSRLRLPLRVVAPFDASLVMVVTALNVSDAQAIARTLEVTEEPQCWRRTILERFPPARP
jgi:hypothetical protein